MVSETWSGGDVICTIGQDDNAPSICCGLIRKGAKSITIGTVEAGKTIVIRVPNMTTNLMAAMQLVDKAIQERQCVTITTHSKKWDDAWGSKCMMLAGAYPQERLSKPANLFVGYDWLNFWREGAEQLIDLVRDLNQAETINDPNRCSLILPRHVGYRTDGAKFEYLDYRYHLFTDVYGDGQMNWRIAVSEPNAYRRLE